MDTNSQAGLLAEKIKHQLVTNFGQTIKNATIEEFYQAFCAILREEIMINWTAAIETIQSKKAKMANFLSMEYLPGRFFGNNLTNIGAHDLVKAVLAKMNRNLVDLINCETDPGLGHGGLGRLASCFLDSLATLHYPVRAYGLRYHYGIFEQEIWNGVQVERPDCWLLNINPWEARRDIHAVGVHFRGRPIHGKNKHGEDVFLLEDYEEVRALPYDIPIIGYSPNPDFSVLTLRLWSTKESPRNFLLQRYNAGFLDQAAENTSLTDVLYPNDNTELGKRMRLKQEFLLVSASLQDVIRRHLQIHGDLSSFKEKERFQINDTHAALLIAEIIRTLTKNFEFSWKDAVETCQACCSYTNHTILREALEEWNEHRIVELLPRQHQIIQRLNLELCTYARERYPNDEEKIRRLSMIEGGQARMANLAIFGSHKVNGVAKLHTEILKERIFHDFHELNPEKFINITNGVTQRRWLLHANPLLSNFITHRIGKGWVLDFSQIAKLRPFAEDPKSQEEFLEIKKKNKQAFLKFLTQENAVRNASGKIIAHSPVLDQEALFDVQIKRFHEYKRQLLNALHLIAIYQELLDNPDARKISRLAIFGGKAAAGYARAKEIIQLISALSRKFHSEGLIQKKLAVAFIENYSVTKAEAVIPAADLSQQISTAGWEASGTGNMKLAINGALTIGTEDGANIEMREAVTDAWWPFRFGGKASDNQQPYNPWDIYNNNPRIKRAVDALKDGTFSQSEEEHNAFQQIHHSLVGGDPFRLLQDFTSYYETQKRAEDLFSRPKDWAKFALHNISSMGNFSTDRSIREYAEKIWEISPCPLEKEFVEKIRQEYAEHNWFTIHQ